MAEEVIARSIEHIASAGRPAEPRRRRCGGALPFASRTGARAGHRARAVARSPVPRLHPTLVYDDRAGISGLHSRRRPVYRRARRLHRRHDESLHGHLAGRAGARPARGQRPRLAPRLDGVSRNDARPVYDRRIDGDVQRDSVRPRAPARGRHPPWRAVHIRPGASLGVEVGQDGRRDARSRSRGSQPTIAIASTSTPSPTRSRKTVARG